MMELKKLLIISIMDTQKLIKVMDWVVDKAFWGSFFIFILLTVVAVLQMEILFRVFGYLLLISVIVFLASLAVVYFLNIYQFFRDKHGEKDGFIKFFRVWGLISPFVAPILIFLAFFMVEIQFLWIAMGFFLISFFLSLGFSKKTKRFDGYFIFAYALFVLLIPLLVIIFSLDSDGRQYPRNAKIKATMSQLRSSMLLEDRRGAMRLVEAVNKETGKNYELRVSSDNQRWCMKVELFKDFWDKATYYCCVDSEGYIGDSDGCNPQDNNYSCR